MKMLGLEERSIATVRHLRKTEIENASRFRMLTVITVGLCKFTPVSVPEQSITNGAPES